MALSTLTYNSSSGSDTAASGAGPATAITGTAAAHTGGFVSTTITLTNTPDLSGVSVNDVIWIDDGAGNRKLSRITAVDDGADTVTTEDNFNIASGSAKNYAIGGKRQTLDADTTNIDIADAKEGWRFELEGTGDYNIAGTQTISVGGVTSGNLEIAAAAGAAPVIKWTGDFAAFTVSGTGFLRLEGLTFSNTVSTSNLARCIHVEQNGSLQAFDCGGSTKGEWLYALQGRKVLLMGCDISSTSFDGVEIDNGRTMTQIINCVIHNCGGHGIKQDSQLGLESFAVIGCVIRDNTTAGLWMKTQGSAFSNLVMNNTFHANGTDGIEMQATVGINYGPVTIINNLLTDNGAYGIQGLGSSGYELILYNDYNAFRGNTTAEVNGITKGTNSVTLTADPYEAVASDDYRLNGTAGGGESCRNAGYPDSV